MKTIEEVINEIERKMLRIRVERIMQGHLENLHYGGMITLLELLQFITDCRGQKNENK